MTTKFSEYHLKVLRFAYSSLGRIDPCSEDWKRLSAQVEKLDNEKLAKLAQANIRFVSIHCAGVLLERDDCPANQDIYRQAARNITIRVRA